MNELPPKPEGKGALVLKLTNENFVQVGDAEIYLRAVEVSGKRGWKPVVSIRIVAPKDMPIRRRER